MNYFLKTIAIMGVCFLLSISQMKAQKVAFLSSDEIRSHFPAAKQADQRIQSLVDEWKREIKALETQIENLEFDIQKNRLIWSDSEKEQKEKELEDLKTQKNVYARTKFEPGGEYDQIVQQMMLPIEEKIYAAVREVSVEQGFDIVWDKSLQPLAYVNFKYDITVKVLRKLGVDVDKLEEELEQKISKDPRNAEKQTKDAPRKRSRSRITDPREVEREESEGIEKMDEKPGGAVNPEEEGKTEEPDPENK
jgi:outer membrane protein